MSSPPTSLCNSSIAENLPPAAASQLRSSRSDGGDTIVESGGGTRTASPSTDPEDGGRFTSSEVVLLDPRQTTDAGGLRRLSPSTSRRQWATHRIALGTAASPRSQPGTRRQLQLDRSDGGDTFTYAAVGGARRARLDAGASGQLRFEVESSYRRQDHRVPAVSGATRPSPSTSPTSMSNPRAHPGDPCSIPLRPGSLKMSSNTVINVSSWPDTSIRIRPRLFSSAVMHH